MQRILIGIVGAAAIAVAASTALGSHTPVSDRAALPDNDRSSRPANLGALEYLHRGRIGGRLLMSPAVRRNPVVAAAGDICGSPTDCAPTAAVIRRINPTRLLPLGDNAYPDGTRSDYADFYAPNWGRFKGRTRPVPGNHDYHVSGAAGYFAYFGARAPASYYSYNLGTWHLIALDSEVSADQGSQQERWLRADLAANRRRCTRLRSILA